MRHRPMERRSPHAKPLRLRRWLPLLALALVSPPPAGAVGPLLVDNFEGDEARNRLGNPANIFLKAPSKAMVIRRLEETQGRKNHVLFLRYKKQAGGGPGGAGGWCGYYTLLKSPGVRFQGPGRREATPGRCTSTTSFWNVRKNRRAQR